MTRPNAVAVYGYPVLRVDQDEIIALLNAGQFGELDRLFHTLEEATRRDITREVELDAAYRSFFGSDARIGPRLDEWVSTNPRSATAYVARAQFYNARAWSARGEKRVIDDPMSMSRSRAAGFRDVGRALDLDPDNFGAYSTALSLLGSAGWSLDAASLVEQALDRFPSSYWLRHLALSLMEPRWGGSYALMRGFAQDAQRYIEQNSRLATLRAAPIIEEAASLSLSSEYVAALAKLEEARAYGVDWDFYYQMGRTLYHAGRPLAAVAALDSAFAIRPVSQNVLEYRGKALYRSAQNEVAAELRPAYLQQAVADLADAIRKQQSDADLSEFLSFAVGARARCTEQPADCFARSDQPPIKPGPWWWHLYVFLSAVPYVVYQIFAEGGPWHLLPAPLLAAAMCLRNLPEWRRQRYWVPRVVHFLGILGFSTIVLINVGWLWAGGRLWTMSYVVNVVFGILPYVVYLAFGGPRRIGRRRAPVYVEASTQDRG